MSKSFLLTIAAALAAYLLLPLPGISSSLDNKIGKTRNQIAGKRAHEQVLTTEISSYGVRIETLQGDISDLQTREARVQVQLDAKEAELTRIRNRRQIVQDRLTRLRTKLVADRKLLAGQLVALYKDDEPDMVTVVLEARGFTDLLDRAEYVDRISTQNNEIVTRVRDTTHEVGIAERRLQVLEGQAQDAADAILTKRNQIAAAKQTVVSRQNDLKAARNVRAGALSRIRASRQDLEGNLHDLEARQAKIQARLQAASTGVPVSGGPIRQGSGQFIWPVNGPITSGFGARNIGAGNEF